MTLREWGVRLRRRAGGVRPLLLLGACLLLATGRLFGQREVIATAVTATPQTPPPPERGRPTRSPRPAPPPGAIQQAAFVPEPSRSPPSGTGVSPGGGNTSMLPPTALLSGMSTSVAEQPERARRPRSGAAPATTAAAVAVEVRGPRRLLLGQPLAYEIVLRNTGERPVAELHVEEPLPPGVRALKADPPALTHDHRLTWDLRKLEVGGERRLKVELNPGRAGELDLRPYVTFLGGDGLRTKVTRPPFSVAMSADRTKAARGERLRFTIRVANHGDTPITNIHLYDHLPPELHHPQGAKIGTDRFGDLRPGQTRTITLETTAVKSGTFRNEVLAQADHGLEARAAVEGTITEPSLSLRLDGPAKTVTRRVVEFHLRAANPTPLPAKNVRLVQTLPPTFEVVSASPGASLDRQQHTLVWSLSDLRAGQRQTVTFRVRADLAGDWPLCAALLSQDLPEVRVCHTLHAEAAAALKLEVRAGKEQLAVGEETVFRMHVFNKGDAPCAGLRLTASLPEAVTLLDARGPSNAQVEPHRVSFAPLAQFDNHADGIYRLRVRGRQADTGSLRVELTADEQAPVVREISIQVRPVGETPLPSAKDRRDAGPTGTANSASRETLR